MNTLHRKIGIGSVQFGTDYGISNHGGRTPEGEVGRIIKYAERSAIEYIDTAYAYGDAEQVLGNFDLSVFKIVSKYIPSSVSLIYQFEQSLKRLGVLKIYGYLAHRPFDLLENEKGNWKTMLDFQKKGKVKKIGASFNSVDELERILDSGIELDIVQVPFNYFDNRFETHLKVLHSKGVEVHTRSTFLQGLFFCNPDVLDGFFDDVKEQIKLLQDCDELPAKLLRYVIEKPFIDVVNIGVNNLTQLEENVSALKKEIAGLPAAVNKIDHRILMPSEWPK